MIQKQDGYIIDTVYPYYFYKEMQPLWLSTVVTFQGSKSPDISNAFSYCELGCGTGLSLIIAAAMNPHARFIGVDFNAQHIKMAQEAVQFIGLKNIQFIYSDFRTFFQMLDEKFDFIFIDAAKGQYKKFFDLAYPKLSDNCIIFIDNIMFKGLVAEAEIPKRYKTIVRKLNEFISYLNDNHNFVLLPFGDGVGLVTK
mgnify:CR=1 FL=1